jgi:hypothetical protein
MTQNHTNTDSSVGDHTIVRDRQITWSYGGGTQSIAIAVLVAQGKLPRPSCIAMANTGREAQETWEYTERFVRPLLASVGLPIYIVSEFEAGDLPDLYGGDDGETLLIPAFTKGGALSTFCSGKWKRDVVTRFFRSMGYGPKKPTINWVGFSLDEMRRISPDRRLWQRTHYPLIWDMRMRREDCRLLIEAAGLPPPPKSSCWMCPYRRNAQWRRLRDFYPDDFERACVLDEEIRANDKQGGVWLHDSRVPLREADLSDPPSPPMLEGMDAARVCDSGMCWV